jgi:predicted amidohydrolase
MTTWKIAGVQLDCRIGERGHNLIQVKTELRRAAAEGAQVVVFPECILTGYAFDSRDEAWPFAEPIPGPTTEDLAADCRALGVWTLVGMLEHGPHGELFNACALIGPSGWIATYRKIHLPFLGVDRFTTPGDRTFAVHDLGGLRLGINICYDCSFPESARTLALLGADLVVLPTNWPPGAVSTVKFVLQTRALENRIYYAAVNRVGEERGFRFIGQSRIIGPDGEILASAAEGPTQIEAAIDPGIARQKRVINIPGKYEIDRVADRRPEMYGPLCEPKRKIT